MNCAGAATVIFDTDVLVWISKGNEKVTKMVSKSPQRYISIMTRMEMLQGTRNRADLSLVESFITDYDFIVLPLTENIGHRALIYVEEYSLGHGLRADDAIIAATAVENNLPLCSFNVKHYNPIKDLKFHPLHV